MQVEQVKHNYSLDTMIRYAFDYELNNLLRIPDKELPEDADARQKIISYMERRISEITKQYK
jgi:hypothetical protein